MAEKKFSEESVDDGVRLRIHQLVIDAFQNRMVAGPQKQVSTPIKSEISKIKGYLRVYNDDDIALGKRMKSELDGPDDEVLNMEFVYHPHVAVVDTPEEYKLLLHESIKLVFETCRRTLSDDQIDTLVNKDFDHEMEHAEKTKGESRITVKYGVAFFESADKNSFIYQPRAYFSGQMTRRMYREVIGGTDWKSKSDEEALK